MTCNNNNNYSFYDFLNNSPSFLILIGLLTVLIPGIYLSEYPAYFSFTLSLLSLLILSFCLTRRAILKVLFWCIIGLFGLAIKNYTVDNDYSSFFPKGDCGAQIKAILVDPGVIGKDVFWISNPKYLKMKILAIRFSDCDKWRNSYGVTNVYFPGKTKGFAYGDCFELKGCFIKPDKALISGSFDYGHYLRSIGINRIFICSEYETLKIKNFRYNIARIIYSIRDKVLNSLCRGIKAKEIKAFLAGFFLGCRQGLDSNIKQNFLRSGTIHILAISGLHIGVLTLILLLLLKPLPITAKFIIIPILLLGYVFLTGFRPSGVRALLMISILCFHRAFFYSFSPINSILFAAVLILLINPYAIGNTGFQFSFIIAGLLILSWQKVNKFLDVITEKSKWKIQCDFSTKTWLRKYLHRKVILLVTTCIIAGVSGTGLVLYYQNLFIPLMFIANIIILPLLLPLFLLGFLKIILTFFWGGFAFFFNYMLNGIVSFILLTTEFGASAYFTNYFQKPSILLLVLLYGLLAFFLISKSNRNRIISFCLLTAIFSFWILGHVFNSGFISILQEKGNNPPIIIVKPNSYLNPIIINCSKKMGFIVLEKLKQEGVNNIECIVMTGASSKCSGGVAYLIEKIGVKKLLVSEQVYKNKLYLKIVELCKKKNISIVYMPGFKKDKDDMKLTVSNIKINIEITEINPGNKKISIKLDNCNEKNFYLKNSNQNQILESKV